MNLLTFNPRPHPWLITPSDPFFFSKRGPRSASDRWAAQLLPTAFHEICRMYVTHTHTHTHTHNACPSVLLTVKQRGLISEQEVNLFCEFISKTETQKIIYIRKAGRYNRERMNQCQCVGDIKLQPWRANMTLNMSNKSYLLMRINYLQTLRRKGRF